MPVSKESQIWQSLVEMGNTKLLRRNEVKELPKILGENELPRALVTGSYKDRFMESAAAGSLVATDWRILFVYFYKTGFFGQGELRVEQFNYNRITSIDPVRGSFSSLPKVAIYVNGQRTEFNVDLGEDRFPFAEHARQWLANSKALVRAKSAQNSQPPEQEKSTQTSQPSIGVADELKKLADLRDAGVLTNREFEAQKQRLLGS